MIRPLRYRFCLSYDPRLLYFSKIPSIFGNAKQHWSLHVGTLNVLARTATPFVSIYSSYLFHFPFSYFVGIGRFLIPGIWFLSSATLSSEITVSMEYDDLGSTLDGPGVVLFASLALPLRTIYRPHHDSTRLLQQLFLDLNPFLNTKTP
jgi:hypothetical protein